MKYQGQRTDGTHAMNGTISLENRPDDSNAPTLLPEPLWSISSPRENTDRSSRRAARAPTWTDPARRPRRDAWVATSEVVSRRMSASGT